MSRIGATPVDVPEGVEVTLTPELLTAKGKLGELAYSLHTSVNVEKEDNQIIIKPTDEDDPVSRRMWGTVRANINNTLMGVSQGFTRILEIRGVGYRANLQGSTLVLELGKSHKDEVPVPSSLKVNVENQTRITVTGSNKQEVGAFSANVRQLRPPEPYKGKGIRYEDEYVPMKEGKKK